MVSCGPVTTSHSFGNNLVINSGCVKPHAERGSGFQNQVKIMRITFDPNSVQKVKCKGCSGQKKVN